MIGVALAWLAACGGSPRAPTPNAAPIAASRPNEPIRTADPDLERAPIPQLLSIDWTTTPLATDADALAVWAKIAPTGFDWDDKLGEIPESVERPLAIALLRGGNFTCMTPPPARDCVAAVFDVRAPAHAAGLSDPCLRRMLALWALGRLEDDDLPKVRDAFRAIAAIPPPESELVAAVFAAIPEDQPAVRLELLAIGWRAGQRDVVNAAVGKLDEPHLVDAAMKHRIDGALEVLSADGHRAAYLAAVTDDAFDAKARTKAMFELIAVDGSLPADVQAAIVKAAGAKDCTVAATAARILEARGDKRFVPRRPRVRTADAMMRAICVLASYEQQQRADEVSLLPGFVPKQGLERVTITYDPLGEVDTDGDGDPHTARTIELVTRDNLVLPEIDDLVRAMRRCTGTTCKSDDREFRFGLRLVGGALVLHRLEVIERPPCPRQ
ncbi:MAG: hypothetical protein H0T89_30905 [Deltaproteobacteria bacterium]|nr:hypothetical protein [Deltaproteobacteria bacterium]MDQ3295377.1 hypothetical protein [Myxococcota bacterium]